MAWTPLPGTSGTKRNAERMVEAIQHFMWLPYSLPKMSRTFEVNLSRLDADFSYISGPRISAAERRVGSNVGSGDYTEPNHTNLRYTITFYHKINSSSCILLLVSKSRDAVWAVTAM